ncbi:hypothetical protein M0802_006051 [Mischocyttarus mexicanus]|nr:hypothetical protein M0802_006051 [Mischocyttarus mexicanus]
MSTKLTDLGETNNNNNNNNNILNEVYNEKERRGTPIQEFYVEQKILITGGTGFLGKVLIEKLLRSCPRIAYIYLLIRSKKEKDAQSRIEELFEDRVFDRMKKEVPKYRDKVVAVCGDCGVEELGLSTKDRKMLENEVTIVFHVAATVRFNEKLKLATAINVRSTNDLLEMCKSMPKLKALVHVSTAYANCFEQQIEERFYTYSVNHEELMRLTKVLSEEELENQFRSVASKWPNMYTFTKAMAESLIKEKHGNLPIGIVRPAIECHFVLENDRIRNLKMCLAIGMYLITGTVSFLWQILMAIGIFLLTLLGKSILFVCALIYTVARSKKQIVPYTVPFETMYPEDYPDFEEDLAAMSRISLESLTPSRNPKSISSATPLKRAFDKNSIKSKPRIRLCFYAIKVISTAYEPVEGWLDNIYGPNGITAAASLGMLRVMHGDSNSIANIIPVDITVNAIIASAWDIYIQNNSQYPSNNIVWYPSVIITKNKFFYKILSVICHTVPATLIDIALLCFGQKPRMKKTINKITNFVEILSFFSLRNWIFVNDNVQNMWTRLHSKDQQLFKFSMVNFDWQIYLHNYMKGIRTYIFKEEKDTLEKSKLKLRRLYWINQIFKILLCVGGFWAIFKILCKIFS